MLLHFDIAGFVKMTKEFLLVFFVAGNTTTSILYSFSFDQKYLGFFKEGSF